MVDSTVRAAPPQEAVEGLSTPAPEVARGRRGRYLFAVNIAVIFVVALGVRLAYWNDARGYAVGGDEPDYVVPAQTLLRDGWYVDTYVSRDRIWTRVPGTALFFAGSFLFVQDPLAAAAEGDDAALMQPRYDALNLAQIGASLLTVACIMLLAARAFPQRSRGAALAAGYMAALYPPLASSPAQRALSEPLSITLAVLALLAMTLWKPEASWRRSIGIAALVGLLLGVGALVRSVALAFVPLACLWFVVVWWAARRDATTHKVQDPRTTNPQSLIPNPLHGLRDYSCAWVSAVVAVVMCFAAIAPWTYYNYKQYGSFLLLETANATAYWHYHNFRGENEDAKLKQYDDPADRLSVIVSEGTSNILQYPDRALAASVFAFFYAWHLESNSAVLLNPWDMTQRDPDVPDLLHSDAAFLLVGLAGMAGLAGVGLRRPVGLGGRTLLALNLWLLMMLGLGVVVPYDARYRLPAAPAVIILASGLLVLANWRVVFSPRRAWAIVRHHWGVAALTALLCAWVLAGAYTPDIPRLLRTEFLAWQGDMALSSGDTQGAFERYGAAREAFPTFYWPYRHEATQAAEAGRDDEARDLYRQAWRLHPDDPYGVLGFADLANRHPEWELTDHEAEWLARDEAEWRGNPWNSVEASGAESVDVGTGRDLANVIGFYGPDVSREPAFDYRWSRGRSEVRLVAPVSTATLRYDAVTLRMSAPGIGPPEPLAVSLRVNGGPETRLDVPAGWAAYTLPLLNPVDPGQQVHISITSPTRTPSELLPGSNDTRHLGVGIDTVSLVSGGR